MGGHRGRPAERGRRHVVEIGVSSERRRSVCCSLDGPSHNNAIERTAAVLAGTLRAPAAGYRQR